MQLMHQRPWRPSVLGNCFCSCPAFICFLLFRPAGALSALLHEALAEATAVHKAAIKTKVVTTAFLATFSAQQVRPAKMQGLDLAETILDFAALGFLAFRGMLWTPVVLRCKRRAVAIATVQPTPRAVTGRG